MVKAYFDYVQSHILGVCNRNKSKCVYVSSRESILIACGEIVLVVSMKTGEVTKRIDVKKVQYVSCMDVYEDEYSQVLSIGFEDGDIVLYQLNDDMEKIDDDTYTYSEHDVSVTCIKMSSNGQMMVSGAMDNTVILWDTVGRAIIHKYTGHSSSISSVVFFKYFNDSSDYILSSSKDGCLRIWDIDTRRCIDIISTKKNEVLGMETIKGLKFVRNELMMALTNSEDIIFYEMKITKADNTLPIHYEERGRLVRNNYNNIISTDTASDIGLVFILNDNKMIEVIKMKSKQDVSNKFKRKKKRTADTVNNDIVESIENKDEYMNDVSNWFECVKNIRLKTKADSIRYIRKYKNIDHLLCIMYSNNTYDIKIIEVGEDDITMKDYVSYDNMGHQTVVRSLSFNRDDTMLISTSMDVVKVWSSLINFNPIKTIQISDIISSTFLPLKSYACLCSRTGNIYLLNVDTGDVEFEYIKCHDDTIWNVDCGMVDDEVVLSTASSDGYIKFWSLTQKVKSKKMCLEIIRSVSIGEPVQWAKFSTSAKFYAAALMDNSIQVRYFDSDKLFISLYGHKMPVLCIDYSSDDTLIVSGSSDKYIRLWGTDFGDCHCALLAHSSAVTQVRFVKDTHYIFSAGRDGVLRYWDGDRRILVKEFTTTGHDIWCLAVSSLGDMVLVGGKERLIRCFKQGKEQIFAHVEEDTRKEKTIVEGYLNDMKDNDNNETLGKRNIESLKHGEDIIEAIVEADKMREDYIEYEEDLMNWKKLGEKGPKPKKPDMMRLDGSKSLPEYIFNIISRTKNSNLQGNLRFLHFSHAEKLLVYIRYCLINNIYFELSIRVLLIIVDNYHQSIITSKKWTKLIDEIRSIVMKRLNKEIDMIGFSLAGLKLMNKEISFIKEEKIELPLFK